ncbi:hypothetical protein HDU80_003621 [Chytriomyces hyalinus]|nr:hypothetical protein HDU80_003621 [Chytriomyces hyalinus]
MSSIPVDTLSLRTSPFFVGLQDLIRDSVSSIVSETIAGFSDRIASLENAVSKSTSATHATLAEMDARIVLHLAAIDKKLDALSNDHSLIADEVGQAVADLDTLRRSVNTNTEAITAVQLSSDSASDGRVPVSVESHIVSLKSTMKDLEASFASQQQTLTAAVEAAVIKAATHTKDNTIVSKSGAQSGRPVSPNDEKKDTPILNTLASGFNTITSISNSVFGASTPTESSAKPEGPPTVPPKSPSVQPAPILKPKNTSTLFDRIRRASFKDLAQKSQSSDLELETELHSPRS